MKRPKRSIRGRLILWLGLAFVPVPASGEAWTQASGPESKPNFMIILVDDWAYSDLQAVREDDSPWNDLPVIDALAARGQSWNQFYSQPICNLTRRTLMFGNYMGRSLAAVCTDLPRSIPLPSQLTIASNLRGLGYRTAAFGKWHVGPNPNQGEPWEMVPAAYGFDQWRALNASNLNRHCGSTNYSKWHRVDDGKGRITTEYHTTAVARAARDWWRETQGPKFAYVCFQAPHTPLHSPPSELLPDQYPAPESSREEYEAMLVAMDGQLGELLTEVDFDSTFVFLLADNGTPPLAIRSSGQEKVRVKKSVYQDGIHVPFIVAGPGIAPGETDSLGHVVDLLATINELAGADLSVTAHLDSTSLAPVLGNPTEEVRDNVVSEIVTVQWGIGRREKVILHEVAVLLKSPETGHLLKGLWTYAHRDLGKTRRSRYDLSLDPGELNPIALGSKTYGEEFERIEEIHRAYLRRNLDPEKPEN